MKNIPEVPHRPGARRPAAQRYGGRDLRDTRAEIARVLQEAAHRLAAEQVPSGAPGAPFLARADR